MCNGKPPLLNQSNSPEAVQERIVARIEQSISKIDSGQPFDWNNLDYFEWRLIEIYRQSEIEMDRKHKSRVAVLFESLKQQSR